MREGFGIEDPGIPLERRMALLEVLSSTGLGRICVGAFVSPRYVPQMACFEELLRRLRPREGVMYTPFVHTRKARKLAERYAPPLTLDADCLGLFIDICDIHQRRNMNRSIVEVMTSWPQEVAEARRDGITTARVAVASAWGSNFAGPFTQRYRLSFLERQHELLQAAGIEVMEIGLHDSQSWCLPHEMERDLQEIKRRWPRVKRFHLHMHNARAMALPCIYAALRTLDAEDTVLVDGTLGGIGGGQYCGNGVASGMAATEDLLHMLEGMGIETGVDLDRIIECVWLLEDIIGRPAFGSVSKAGRRPGKASLFAADLPAIETLAAAKHFKLGAAAWPDPPHRPWKQPISGPFYHGAEAPRIAIPS